MTPRVSMLLKSRASLTCFRAYFLPGRAKDLSAPRYITLLSICGIRENRCKEGRTCGRENNHIHASTIKLYNIKQVLDGTVSTAACSTPRATLSAIFLQRYESNYQPLNTNPVREREMLT